MRGFSQHIAFCQRLNGSLPTPIHAAWFQIPYSLELLLKAELPFGGFGQPNHAVS